MSGEALTLANEQSPVNNTTRYLHITQEVTIITTGKHNTKTSHDLPAEK